MAEDETRAKRHEPQRIVFFGDSICVGQGVSIHRSWVSRIAAEIDSPRRSDGSSIVVVNASINGNTTRQALERMPYDVQSHGVALLLVQFGMNDCNYWLSDGGVPRVSPKAFAANIEEIVTRGILFGARKVLLNTNHPTLRDMEYFPLTATTYEMSNRLYNSILRDVASTFDGQLVLNDVERAFDDYAGRNREKLGELLLDDGLHLSVRGHDIYFDVIMPKVRHILATELGL